VTSPLRSPGWRARSRSAALALLLAANAGVFLSFTLPRGLQARSMSVQARTLGAEVERERSAVARLRARDVVIESNARDEAALLAQLPDARGGLPQVLGEIERLAQEAGAKPGARSYSPEPLRDVPLVRVGISLPLSGRYAQVVKFLTLLEASPSFLVVERMQLRENSGATSLDIGISAYLRADSQRSQGGR
jgi:Tfp pilus assembly protein PilO